MKTLKARLEATFIYALFGASILYALYRYQEQKRERQLHPPAPFSESDSAPYRGSSDRP